MSHRQSSEASLPATVAGLRPVGAPLWPALERHIRQCHQRALSFSATVGDSFRPESVHKLRTHLRRLQAYAELLEHEDAARLLARRVSWFSRLRSLHVFWKYLKETGAPKKDRRRVKPAMRDEQKKLCDARRAAKVRQLLAKMTPRSFARPERFLQERFERLRHENRTRLAQALQGLRGRPRRKELHRFRLLVKALRYQQEIASELHWGNPATVNALKRLQGLLGDFSDREQFVRLAKELKLRDQKTVKADRRRYRKRACRALLKIKARPAAPAEILHLPHNS